MSISIIISIVTSTLFISAQYYFFRDTRKYRILFQNFFKKAKPYSISRQREGSIYDDEPNTCDYVQLELVGTEESDLNNLIREINNYILKTKGTTDFSVIQNKVERKLNMRYDQSTARLSFPTYLGLLGTFFGVFIGISSFVLEFDSSNITDDAIIGLLAGVLVSMITSLCGLGFTTYNNFHSGGARKQIEEDKNEFYDFIQTELMPTIDVSMVAAITKLHDTVDKFEPAFERVINKFQTTFDKCTDAFGKNFEKNVSIVTDAVDIMGRNMDKINHNINLQEDLLSTLKSGELIDGMEKYIQAANHFGGITQSLNKFKEARRMMLAATQETITMQQQYSESLKITRETAIKINQILDRIKTFENNINILGEQIAQREILGNEIINIIKSQVDGIAKKGKIADKYLGVADGKLEDLFKKQSEVIDSMNHKYGSALEKHLIGFEKILEDHEKEIISRRNTFMAAIENKLSIEEVHQDFSNLKKLNDINKNLSEIASTSIKLENLHNEINLLQSEFTQIRESIDKLNKVKEEAKSSWNIFGGRK